MLIRIDHNVEDIEANVNQGQQQLLKYMSYVSSNRMLMVKVFMALILFILLFVLFT